MSRLTRRDFLKHSSAFALGGLVFAPSVAGAMAARKGKRRPNVLFISIDDLRPQLACYGQSQTLSPNLDRLATESVAFTNHFCSVPGVCTIALFDVDGP